MRFRDDAALEINPVTLTVSIPLWDFGCGVCAELCKHKVCEKKRERCDSAERMPAVHGAKLALLKVNRNNFCAVIESLARATTGYPPAAAATAPSSSESPAHTTRPRVAAAFCPWSYPAALPVLPA